MAKITPFPLIEISGAPRQRGRIYGEAARERIRLSAGLYTDQLHRLGFDDANIERLVTAFLPRIRDYLRRALSHPALAALRDFYGEHGLLEERTL